MQNQHDVESTLPQGSVRRAFSSNSRRIVLIFLDIGCFLLSYLLTTILTAFTDGIPAAAWLKTTLNSLPHLLLLLAFLMAGRLILMVYRNLWRYPNVRAYLSLVVADTCSGTLAFFASYALFTFAKIPHIFYGFWHTFCVVVLFDLGTLIMRFAYQLIHQHGNVASASASRNKIGVAIVGAGQIGAHLAEELRSPFSHYYPVCFIDKDAGKIGMRVSELKVYAEDDTLFEKLQDLPIQEVFVAIADLDPQESTRLIKQYSDAGYKVKRYDFPLHDDTTDAGPGRGVVRNFRMEDLLGRESLEKKINSAELKSFYHNRVVLVTGGGGSIGSEICRQIAKCQPKKLIILDIYENNAYDIQQELIRKYGDKLNLAVEIASVRDEVRLDCIFKTYRPEIVFHAAAHKHVPLMEHSACEAIKNNVMGTYNTANMAEKYGVSKFVLVSTDKAVNPTNVMGASKRMCEMVVQCRKDSQTTFAAVRFGNVLGSNGSVIPLFKKQIEMGGPITLTDKRIVRYFMTIPEASRLVLLAGSMAEDGELFVLDMGKPVRILEMAENMVRMMGYVPYQDIDIQEVGLRPGEKLFEELLIKTEGLAKTKNNLIFIETDTPLTRAEVDAKLDILRTAVKNSEGELASPAIKEALKSVVPTFCEPEEVNETAEDSDEVKAANSRTADTPTEIPV